MSGRDEPNDDRDLYEEVPPRSIFAATWFRVVLVVIVLGVIGAVAVPYVLDWMNPPVARTAAVPKSSPVATPLAAPTAPADKKDPAPSPTAAPALPADAKADTKPEPRAETKPSPPRVAESRPAAKPESKTASPSPEAKGTAAMAVTEAPKTDTPSKPEPPIKPDAASPNGTKTASVAKDDPKPATATKSSMATRVAAKTSTPPSPSAAGPFWVQVGAFKDVETAKRLAAKLREDNFKVEESTTRAGAATATAPRSTATASAKPADGSADRYDVFVSGQSTDELNKRLGARGLAAEASGAGVVVRPSLPLRDAVALSKDLAVDGFKVQVKRAGGAAATASPAAAPATTAAEAGGLSLHRVRVGAFADRASAQAAAQELQAKGYKPFIARGEQ